MFYISTQPPKDKAEEEERTEEPVEESQPEEVSQEETTEDTKEAEPVMGKFQGYATMFLRMPMSTSTLPVEGRCAVEDKKVTLKFPFTGIEFDLPGSPGEKGSDFDFKIRGARGDMRLAITYDEALGCYLGVGKQEEEDVPVLTFSFFPDSSPMLSLKKVYGL